jgi:hypothetical protein
MEQEWLLADVTSEYVVPYSSEDGSHDDRVKGTIMSGV